MSSLDSAMNNDFLMISKSIVPYLDADKQRSVAVFIKAFELMSTIDLFSKEEFVRSISKPRDAGWEKNFLGDIRANLSDDRGYFIDAILKISEMRDMLVTKNNDNINPVASTYSTPNTSPPQSTSKDTSHAPNNAAQMIDKLSSVLEPNQLQILKMLSAFIK